MNDRRVALAQAGEADLGDLSDLQVVDIIGRDLGDDDLGGVPGHDLHQRLTGLDHAALGEDGQADDLARDRCPNLVARDLGPELGHAGPQFVQLHIDLAQLVGHVFVHPGRDA